MSKYYPRIPVGDGKFCYSGPNCRDHGGKTAKNESTSQTYQQRFSEVIKNHLIKSKPKLTKAICESSNSVKNLSDLGDQALLTGLAANECKEHDEYHVYSIQKMHTLVNTFRHPLMEAINEEVKTGKITQVEANVLRSDIKEQLIELNATTISYDRHIMRRFQKDFASSGLAEEAKKARELEADEARARSIRVPKPVVPYSPPILQASEVDDKAMLTYWQCGRKTRYDSPEKGLAVIAKNGEETTMSAYKCSHCPEYHIGHGSGKEPVEGQLVRARIHWDTYTEKANKFTLENNLPH
jgi:hypothetical protein